MVRGGGTIRRRVVVCAGGGVGGGGGGVRFAPDHCFSFSTIILLTYVCDGSRQARTRTRLPFLAIVDSWIARTRTRSPHCAPPSTRGDVRAHARRSVRKSRLRRPPRTRFICFADLRH